MSDKYPWFRLYNETLKDGKISCIADMTGYPVWGVLGAWSALLCLANGSPVRGFLYYTKNRPMSKKDIYREIQMDPETADVFLNAFIEMEMVSLEDGVYGILNFDKRQFAGTSSTERVRQYRERMRKAGIDGSYESLRSTVLERDEYNCVYCGRYGGHADHIFPVSKGGETSETNLVAACEICNKSKNNEDMIAWYRRQSFFDKERFDYINFIMAGGNDAE